jgi:hypothetical protein
LLGLSSLVTAQTVQTTPNLITSGTNHTWYGVNTGAAPSGCGANGDGGPCGGGPTPLYDPATNMISFSYNASASVGQTMAINQALANVGAGVKISGYTYSYDVRNMNGDNRQPGTDTFTVSQLLRGPSNSVLLSSSQYYNTKFEWQTVTGNKVATTPYNIADTSYIQFGVQGGDNGYWGGYFGPQIRNVDMRLSYTVDPCVSNPLYSPNCPNYNQVLTSQSIFAQSYAINQALNLSGAGVQINGFEYGYHYYVGGSWCSSTFLGIFCDGWSPSSMAVDVNVTSDTGASLYTATHNHTEQNAGGQPSYSYVFPQQRLLSTMGNFSLTTREVGSTALYSSWSRWQYTPDPCVANPLSSTSCPGYQQAYEVQMCTANPLYSSSCPGYAQAMFTQQCNANQLSNPTCPGYAQAYLTYQCTLDPLYSTTCAGYETAYFNQQCSLDPLYSNRCSGYSTAYHDQQCSLNPLYATDCTGYSTAYQNQQCSLNPLYSTSCSGYAAAYLTQQCSTNPLYSTQCSGYAVAYQAQQCTANPLYATDCPGYAAAYKTQQCSISALYATDCPGYATAYKTQQCSLNALYATDCPGYATAYKTQQCAANALYATDCPGYDVSYKAQQCSLSALYATDCPGYAVAFKAQQCSLNTLYATDCPGYEQAYLNSQCIKDSLYSTQCEGYKTAYAIKYLVGLNPAVTSAVNSSLTNTVEVQRNDPANVTGTVDAVATATGSTSTSTTPSATTSATSVSPVAVISTIKPAPAPTQQMAQAEPKKDEPKKEEGKKDGNNNSGPSPSADTKPSGGPKSNREALAERRRDAAQKEAVAKGGNLANEMGKA